MEFRPAKESEISDVVNLMRADSLGRGREGASPATYIAAFRKVRDEPNADIIVGVQEGAVMATYQINILHGISRGATTRAQIEAVRVHQDLRGQGVGKKLMQDAEERAKAAGATLIQLTSDRTRPEAHDFYSQLGYDDSHVGFKKALN